MKAVKKKGVGGGKLGRTEIVQVRFDPQLRFGAELAARAESRTLSSYIQSAVSKNLQAIQIDLFVNDSFFAGRSASNPVMLTELVRKLWDSDEVMRFINLAQQAPLLLSPDERMRWDFIKKERSYWRNPSDSEPPKLYIKFLKAMWRHLVDEVISEDDYDWELHHNTLISVTQRAPETAINAYKKAVKQLRDFYDED